MSLLLEGFTIISFGKEEKHSSTYPQWSAVAIQLAVVPGLHISPVVLIEVGQAVIHEDIALRGETDGETVTHIQTVKSQERKTHTSVNLPFEVLHHWWHFHFGGHGGHENAEWAGNCKLRAKCAVLKRSIKFSGNLPWEAVQLETRTQGCSAVYFQTRTIDGGNVPRNPLMCLSLGLKIDPNGYLVAARRLTIFFLPIL